MEIVGIICEYNPFHNGHKYHIEKIKEMYKDSLIIACINGYFMQRGEISILTKEEKVKLALENGIDLIVELPFTYGTQSADYFAYASLKILSSLGITTLVFGSETNSISYIQKIAIKQLQENFTLKKEKNNNYPTILASSLNQETIIPPNDLLAISYLKEIQKRNYKIKPIAIKRTSSYHDLEADEEIISASNIRKKYYDGKDIKKYLPFTDLNRLSKIDEEKMFELLSYKILTDNHLEKYLDVVEGLENKLKKEVLESHCTLELIKRVKSKRYTYNRIQRMLTHVLLGLRSEVQDITYIHVLGMNKKGANYLKEHKKEILLPTVVDKNSSTYHFEILSSLIYDMITSQNTYQFEKKNQPIYIQDASFKESSQK